MRDQDRHHRIVTMWISGLKTASIAREVRMHRQSMVRTAHNIGLPKRVPGKRRRKDRNLWPAVVAWAKAGYSPEQIADGIGVTGRAREILVASDALRYSQRRARMAA